ncbi:MAG: FIST C-terminal domain-containing protein [Magnetococcus sp. WYHC-3]
MKLLQSTFRDADPATWDLRPLEALAPHLLLAFGHKERFAHPHLASRLAAAFPGACRVGCSTAGEISTAGVADGTVVLTAIHLEHTTLDWAATAVANIDASEAAGLALAQQLTAANLQGVAVFAPGIDVNGSALLKGLAAGLPREVPVVGGLAGDNGAFRETLTLTPEGVFPRQVVAVGFCGTRCRLGHGSFGGWLPFGPARRVTRSLGNILYELDEQPALALYREYLGEYASGLPASGLLFPFEMLDDAQEQSGLIRTILGIDEAEDSLILAGDIHPGGYLRLMHAQVDTLVSGAQSAAHDLTQGLTSHEPGLALLVSCVGRKLVMGDHVDEEVEAVLRILPPGSVATGFYSYGEISPRRNSGRCELHNQTMTVALLQEI